MAFVVWREWYNEAAVKQLTEMGTLPRYETEVDDFDIESGGDTVAKVIAQKAYEDDPEQFAQGGKLVIVEPSSIAGTYEITTDYEPTFYACRSDLE